MQDRLPEAFLEVLSTCPPSRGPGGEAYIRNVVEVARWSERHGYTGMLIYTDNSLVDPWLVAQTVVQCTQTLCPLVAVQPVYMHPFSAAKMVSSLGYLYDRRVFLNMVAGGFSNDLLALDDTMPHDRRYERLVEYTMLVQKLLAGPSPVSHEGEFYKVTRAKLTPALPPALAPRVFVSGSSEAGLAAAKALDATAVQYPRSAGESETALGDHDIRLGIRVGILTREDEDEAWRIAHARFPPDRKGEIMHQLAMKVSDSAWHQQLSRFEDGSRDGPYWLVPFKNYKTFCPYLVGSYSRVAQELARYVALGYKTFILDVPPEEEELYHTSIVFARVTQCVAR